MDKVKFEKTEDIREALIAVFNDLAEEKISTSQAYALSNIVGKMLQSLRIDIQVFKLTGAKGTDPLSSKLLS